MIIEKMLKKYKSVIKNRMPNEEESTSTKICINFKSKQNVEEITKELEDIGYTAK